MKIKRFDQNHIKIQDIGNLSKLIIGPGGIAIGLLILLFWPMRGELECKRGDQDLCVLIKWSILSTQKTSFPLEQVLEVVVNEYTSSEGIDYYVRLITRNGQQPIANFFFRNKPYQISNLINGFLTNQSQNNVKVNWDQLWVIIPGFASTIFGVVYINSYRRKVLDLNKYTGKATFVSQKLFSSEKTEILLKYVVRAEVVYSIWSDHKKFGVDLVRTYGNRILICTDYSRDREGQQKIADEINRFLGIDDQRVSLR